LGLFCLPMAPGRYPEHDMALNPLGTWKWHHHPRSRGPSV
jgi:hypothetical protein